MSFRIDAGAVGAAGLWAAGTLAAMVALMPHAGGGRCTGAGRVGLHFAATTGPTAVPGEIVVGFRSGVDGAERAAARSAADVRAKRNLSPGARSS